MEVGRPHEPGDDRARERVGAAYADAEQPRGERFVVVARLRPVDGDQPDRGRTVTVAATSPDPFAVDVALTA